MNLRLLFLVFLLSNTFIFSQESNGNNLQQSNSDKRTIGAKEAEKSNQGNKFKSKTSKLSDSVSIDMYKIYTVDRDSTYVDTTLTIQKEYKMNFLRKDYFELIPFSNTGHAFNKTGYDFSSEELLSGLGARSKHLGYLESSDVLYYQVPTPLTELFFRTTFEQGQMAQTTIAINLTPQFNFAFTYKGTRSLGKYVNLRSANERFEFSFKYHSVNNRYALWGHYTNQSIENQENGGIDAEGIFLFESDDPDFSDRSLFDNQFKNANSRLSGKRLFIDQNWNLVPPKDSVRSQILVGHRFLNESRYFNYVDSQKTAHFGDFVLGSNNVNDLAKLKRHENKVYAEFNNPHTGKLRAGLAAVQSNYFFVLDDGESISEDVPNQIKTTQYIINGDWKFRWKGFSMQAILQKSIGGSLLSDEISAQARYEFPREISFTVKTSFRNQTPDFNFQLYKSDYQSYNWYNPDLENQKTTHFSLDLQHPMLGSLYAHWQKLSNYTYYNTISFAPGIEDPDVDTTSIIYRPPAEVFLAAPDQALQAINYIKIRYISEFKLSYFAITNTAQYQKVTGEEESYEDSNISLPLNVPKWNIRATLSFSRDIFQKALYLQTGITGHYFTKYFADRYNPLLGDFSRQSDILIGDFPRIDFFVNGKVQQTRLYLKAEHINTLFTKPNYFSAPGYPYRDFVIRFGLVWNFFQ
tara:strand:- start:410 stop:2485 length:2076 start_codon:yes stop_codon:yes gene_type:complete